MDSEGVDLNRLKPEVEYTLEFLTTVFPLGVQALRKEIREKKLKARRKGKILLVLGKDAASWWRED
jgi:hypothetical protein